MDSCAVDCASGTCVLIDHQADLRLLACLHKLLRRKAERRDRGELSVRRTISNFANL